MTTATIDRTTWHVTDAGPSLKKVSIEIPASKVGQKLAESLDMLTSQAALPGFRQGKAPRWLVEKRFGGAVRKEARQQLASEAFRAAIDDLKLKMVGDAVVPGSIETIELSENKPFKFDVEVEVLPEFTLPKLEGISVKRPTLEVTDSIVTEELSKACINEGSLEGRDVAEPGDYLTGHAVMKGKEGTEFYNLDGAVIQKPTTDKSGKGMILGIMVDDFDKQLGNPKAGDSVTIRAKGPEQHEVEAIRGNDLTMTFEVKRIDRIIPAKVEDLVKQYGFESDQQIKDAIRQRLAINVRVQQQSAQHQQIAKYLLDSVEMTLPQRLTAQQAGRNLERRRLELMYRGVDQAKIEEHMAELRQASGATAQRDLKLFFILVRAAEELQIGINETEVNNRIMQMAMQRNVRPDVLRNELIRTNQVGTVVQQVREHKTLDAILARANVTEISADEYNKSLKNA
jgi:trigger factor